MWETLGAWYGQIGSRQCTTNLSAQTSRVQPQHKSAYSSLHISTIAILVHFALRESGENKMQLNSLVQLYQLCPSTILKLQIVDILDPQSRVCLHSRAYIADVTGFDVLVYDSPTDSSWVVRNSKFYFFNRNRTNVFIWSQKSEIVHWTSGEMEISINILPCHDIYH